MLFDILSTESQVRANSILVFFQQIHFWCVFFHISQAQEEEGDREEKIEKFQVVMLSVSKRLHC